MALPNQQTVDYPSFKLVIVGDGGTGMDPNLHFVESPALAPPEVQIDMVAQQQHEAELAVAANQPLPDDDDDAFE
ncbi:hypothetical protein M8C21_030723 [Ambrosia artemisiifolia]|uniref:Uncharacterized protein n=1 Tax=Ambrosia artemisiifolia TaxID=4212 RepID=A0AAD5CKN0_AMBAR|nr:hypothetical protein M8C21_030723 [Ambrosia artemisiifolia]